MSGFGLATSAEETFELLLEGAPDAIVVTRRDGRMVVVNSQTERMFGYHREELLGKKVEVLMAQRVRRQHVKNRAAFLKHPGTRTMGSGLELYGLRKDLTEFPVDVSLSQVETAGGMLVSSHIRDITERKRTEELALHLASIVEASDDAIFASSLDGTVVSWNSGAERLYGYKAEEVVGRPVAVLVPAGPGRRAWMDHEGAAPRQAYRTLRKYPSAQGRASNRHFGNRLPGQRQSGRGSRRFGDCPRYYRPQAGRNGPAPK